MAKKQKITNDIYQQLFEISRRLMTEPEIDQLLMLAMDEAIKISGAERGMIILFDEQGSIQFETARQLKQQEIDQPQFEISKTIIKNVRSKGEPVCLENELEHPEFKKKKSVEKLQLLSVICLPLKFDDKIFGVIYLDNRRFTGIFQKATFCFVEEFAKLISLASYQALERKQLKNHCTELEQELRGKYQFDAIIGSNPKMVDILKLISQIADTDATVLIQGESGTGKELIAQALHYNSHRRDKPFVPVNCGAIPEQLLESELFGHVRGAFTGAVADKVGWFQRANGGTIFLDEISDMSAALQVGLLRVLQTGEYSSVGSSQIKQCDVRIVAASSKNLKNLIDSGQFREEVYYRLNVVDIDLPPLRDRREDIPLLANFFLKKYADKYGKNMSSIANKAMTILKNYSFPGNVRELENIIQRAVVLAEVEKIHHDYLPKTLTQPSEKNVDFEDISEFQLAKKQAVEHFEREFLIRCLKQTNSNITQAAKQCGMHVKNFFDKVKKYGIEASEYKSPN